MRWKNSLESQQQPEDVQHNSYWTMTHFAQAEATAQKLREDPRVKRAQATENGVGPIVKAVAKDEEAAEDLKTDLYQYDVYVEVDT